MTDTYNEPIVFGKATIYKAGGLFGVTKAEVREGSVLLVPYAQYPEAASVRFKKPRAKLLRGFTVTPNHDGSGIPLLVLEGWGHPDPDSIFSEVKRSGTSGLAYRESRYTLADPRYESEFNEKMDAYLADKAASVLYDGRIPTTTEA